MNPKDKIVKIKNAVQWRENLLKNNKKLVVTNGCFDILHRGHSEYLYQARIEGNALLILLNSDTSINKLKGNERPIIDEYSRAYMLASFSFVDKVVLFSDVNCNKELEDIQPDIYIKGGDYTLENMNIEEKNILQNINCNIKFIPFIKGFSTTNIINKLKKKFLIQFLVIFFLFNSSCKEKEVPPPQRSRSQLVINLFKSLEKQNHKNILVKILKLRKIDKTDIFLKILENTEHQNIYILEAKKTLNKGDLNKAIKIIENAIRENGYTDNLSQIKNNLILIKKVNILIDILNNPKTSKELQSAIDNLKKIIESDSKFKFLKQYLQNRLEIVSKMKEFETQRGLFNLYSDMNIVLSKKNILSLTILAEYLVEKNIENLDITKFSDSKSWEFYQKNKY